MTEDYWEWRYLPDGNVVHALHRGSDTTAQCGVGPWLAWQWCGTGTQHEYERASELPKCKACLRKIGARP